MGIDRKKILLVFFISILVIGIGWGVFLYINLTKQNNFLIQEVSLLTTSLSHAKELFLRVQKENTELTHLLEAEKEKISAAQSQIQNMSEVVGTLQKLSQTDKELLKKYSKVYFLNENYIPSRLSRVDPQYTLLPEKEFYFHSDALPFLSAMISSAKKDGMNLKISSAYRSFEDQMLLKTGYKMIYGSGANQFSADQGYSEHQLGTTVDLTTPTLKQLTEEFDKTPEYTWLRNNAYVYGFILSYPKGNSYYEYEPWHWRFVGIALARRLHNEKKNFYDLAQREIDTYLVSIFDR